jgi:hypothetical protein
MQHEQTSSPPEQRWPELPKDVLDAARSFIAGLPWRWVQARPAGPLNKPPEPHQYVIEMWDEVDRIEFARFVATIRRFGYRGRYLIPYTGRTMVGRYLVVDDHVYWSVPNQLCRTLVENRQHEPLDDDAITEEDEDAQLKLL